VLKGGKLAAIKVLSTESKQGVKEFLTEINVISEIKHENLVILYGCCVEGDHRILVYNYLENNSLSQTLLGKCIIIFSVNFSARIENKGLYFIIILWTCYISKSLTYFFSVLAAGGHSNIYFDWQTRRKICVGVARGLAFLHEEVLPHIVHRDIKASNILLDKDLTPKISDFGLAKLIPSYMTHVSTRVAGTM